MSPSIASTARLKLSGFDTQDIDENSPLEDQVVLTYRAVSHFANMNGWEKATHQGKPGRKGEMVMKRITEALFPKAGSTQQDRLNGLINQVLRKTDAAVCIAHPNHRGQPPIWFVSDKMPSNLVIVALSHARGDHTPPPQPSGRAKEQARLERKVTPEEAGEHLPADDVSVRFAEQKPLPNAFLERRERERREHEEFKAAILEAVTGSQVPVTLREVQQLWATRCHNTTTREILGGLVDDGVLASRVETDEEARVRGGGLMPKGKRSKLFAPAPGPVPIRTVLPRGIEPVRSAADWESERSALLDTWCDRVLDELGRPYPATVSSRPRSPGPLAKVTGLKVQEVNAALERLVALELVYENSSCYFLAERRRGPKTPKPEEKKKEEVTVPAPLAPPPPVPVHGDREEMVQEFMRLAQRLAEPEVDTEELERLRAENKKLHSQVAALKAAIATMD